MISSKNLKKKIIQHSIISQTSFKDFIKLMNAMDICLLGEGGSMHIAAALGVPQVVLFGFTSPTTWAPLSNTATVLNDKSNVNNIPKNKILEALKTKLQNIEATRFKN